jgi:uncharacterized cupin superfamily protein
MPKIDIEKAPTSKGSAYPPPFHEVARDRVRRRLGDAGGLGDFGVNLTELPPGNWSSQRHWHTTEDEFVYVLAGEVTLVTDAGEATLRAGDCAAFPKNAADGHHLINKSKTTAVVLEIGTRSADDFCTYPDIDLQLDSRKDRFEHKDGTPYPEPK